MKNDKVEIVQSEDIMSRQLQKEKELKDNTTQYVTMSIQRYEDLLNKEFICNSLIYGQASLDDANYIKFLNKLIEQYRQNNIY